MNDSNSLARIADDPDYLALVRERNRFTWALSGVMLVVYFGFILLIAFDKEALARPVGDGVTSVGIPVGLGIIITAIALTGIYVRRANRDWDALVAKLAERAGE